MELFECQNCKQLISEEDRINITYNRIQGPDDLNIDPNKENALVLSELWYCCECGGYFKAYYKFDKIVMLKENKKKHCTCSKCTGGIGIEDYYKEE